jgi:Zn-dependent oligopeptidase
MPLMKAIEKLKKYYKRLEAGKVNKIKPSHVEKVIGKLLANEHSLLEEIATTKKPSKKQRLEQKLMTTREQIDRAQVLLKKIS